MKKAVIIILTLMMVLGLSTAAYAMPTPPMLGRRSIEIQPPSGDEEPGDDNGDAGDGTDEKNEDAE